ncbi:MAG: TonB family protein [Candidatus Aminicenantales bacterium]
MKDRKVLIVDFDEESLVALSDLVHEEGFKAVAVTDGLAGYEKFKSDDFDLVILEPMLPKLHGFELCKKIIQDPLKKIPIIVVTGIYREPACRAEAIQVYGASAFFTKPWNKEELRAKILELLATTRKPAKEEAEEVPSREEATSPLAPSQPDSREARSRFRESKFDSDLEEIEKELRQAVAGLVKSPQKKEVREKKAPKKDLDQEVEAILKGAISELGLEETKKKAAPPRPTPTFQPTRPVRPISPPPEPLKAAKIPIAEEIKKSFSTSGTSANNIPVSSSRLVDTEETPFAIEKTLLEIDKIPLDLEKTIPSAEKEPELVAKVEMEKEKRSSLFEEYGEQKKKKTFLFAASGVAAVLVLATSLTLFVFKPKKSNPPAKEMVSSLTPSLPAEFSVRQQETNPLAQENVGEPEVARKPEAKKSLLTRPEDQSEQTEEIIKPIVPAELPPIQLHVEAESPSENPPVNPETPPPTSVSKADESPTPAPSSPPQAPQAMEPEPKKIEPGTLIPLTDVSIPPVLLRRVDPRYPSAALTLGQEATVTVNALISETGEVIRTEILKGVKGGYGFEKAAEAAVKQWLFKPAQKNGVNVKVWKPIEIVFKLKETPFKE